MECIFPQDCMCADCRSERHFQRMEDEYERWVNSYWDIPGWDGSEHLDEDEDAGRCLPYSEDHDPVQELPIVTWNPPGTMFGDVRRDWKSVGTYDPSSPSDKDEDILPF